MERKITNFFYGYREDIDKEYLARPAVRKTNGGNLIRQNTPRFQLRRYSRTETVIAHYLVTASENAGGVIDVRHCANYASKIHEVDVPQGSAEINIHFAQFLERYANCAKTVV